MLRPAPLRAAPSIFCDWLEIKVLSSEAGFLRLGDIRRLWDISRETEESDPEGMRLREEDTDEDGVRGGDEDIFLDSITDELQDRQDSLGDCYPFEQDNRLRLLLKPELSQGAYAYLFCLLLSNPAAGEIFTGDWCPKIDHQTRDLFQACATVAAAGEVGGCAFSFGWPRPENNPGFLKALERIYGIFGEGRVRIAPLPGASPAPKDEEIDVIAWRPRADKAAGTFYLLGQVASGGNWEAKSILGGPIRNFHELWFEEIPPSEANASIFIPHAVLPNAQGNRRDRMAVQTRKFGTIFDRLRLPKALADGIELANKRPELVVERLDSLPKVGDWVDTQIREMRVAASK
jgi:hypothetical protein